MIVTDAYAVVERLTKRRSHEQLAERMTTEDLAAPHLLDAEVSNTLRDLLLGERPTKERARRRDGITLT